MASLSLAELFNPFSCCAALFRSRPMEAERLSGFEKETEARERARPLSRRDRLEKDGWRPPEKLRTEKLDAMITVLNTETVDISQVKNSTGTHYCLLRHPIK